jgi:lipoprotein NlpD
MLELRGQGWWCAALVVAAGVLAGCSTPSRTPAPVEDRSAAKPVPPVVAAVEPAKPGLTGAENAGKPGYYTVRGGDTLIRIALDTGQSWRDIAKWNNIDKPNLIEVGQVLRVVPPLSSSTEVGVAVTRPVVSGTAVPTAPGATASAPRGSASGTAVASVAPSPTAVTPQPPVPTESDVPWAWPTTSASVVAGFDEQRNKGLDIAGKPGDAVLASADGKVVYAGAGLRGYGNLIILKHNNTFLSAYAHNQALLVKEDQNVRKGQKIAEMGSSDADRVKLHFEIRRDGKPVDPAKYLPPR